MKKKRMLILLILLVLLFCFAENAYAAGDVSSAIQQTWTAAQSQVKTVVENVVFPVIDMILAVLFLSNSAPHTLTTASMVSLNLLRHAFCLRACSLPLPRRYISGIF